MEEKISWNNRNCNTNSTKDGDKDYRKIGIKIKDPLKDKRGLGLGFI